MRRESPTNQAINTDWETMVDALLSRIGSTVHSRLVEDDGGATAVESAIIAVLVAVIAIGVIGTLGGTLLGWFPDPDPALR